MMEEEGAVIDWMFLCVVAAGESLCLWYSLNGPDDDEDDENGAVVVVVVVVPFYLRLFLLLLLVLSLLSLVA